MQNFQIICPKAGRVLDNSYEKKVEFQWMFSKLPLDVQILSINSNLLLLVSALKEMLFKNKNLNSKKINILPSLTVKQIYY